MKGVVLSDVDWDQVDMALDIARLRSIDRGSEAGEKQFAETQRKIRHQLEGLVPMVLDKLIFPVRGEPGETK